jgi:hypothetical protein
MLLERKEHKKDGDQITLIEAFYDSTNILKTNYIPERNLLFIFFKGGSVYSYSNIDRELYEKFENCESQGKFFIAEIKKKPQVYNYLKEYKMYEFEKQDINEIIENLKLTKSPQNENI